MLYLWVARAPQCESLHLLETAPVICFFRLLLKEAIWEAIGSPPKTTSGWVTLAEFTRTS